MTEQYMSLNLNTFFLAYENFLIIDGLFLKKEAFLRNPV